MLQAHSSTDKNSFKKTHMTSKNGAYLSYPEQGTSAIKRSRFEYTHNVSIESVSEYWHSYHYKSDYGPQHRQNCWKTSKEDSGKGSYKTSIVSNIQFKLSENLLWTYFSLQIWIIVLLRMRKTCRSISVSKVSQQCAIVRQLSDDWPVGPL